MDVQAPGSVDGHWIVVLHARGDGWMEALAEGRAVPGRGLAGDVCRRLLLSAGEPKPVSSRRSSAVECARLLSFGRGVVVSVDCGEARRSSRDEVPSCRRGGVFGRVCRAGTREP